MSIDESALVVQHEEMRCNNRTQIGAQLRTATARGCPRPAVCLMDLRAPWPRALYAATIGDEAVEAIICEAGRQGAVPIAYSYMTWDNAIRVMNKVWPDVAAALAGNPFEGMFAIICINLGGASVVFKLCPPLVDN